MTDEEAQSLQAGLMYLSNTMKNEHDAAWRTGVQSILEEMVLAAAGEAIQRSQLARERLYDVMVPSLPSPREHQPVALSEAPASYPNGRHGFDSEAEFFGHEPASEWSDILRRAG